VYIPVSPLLLEMLHWAELKKRPSGSTGAAPDMLLLLRLSKVQLRSAAVQEEVVQQVRGQGAGIAFISASCGVWALAMRTSQGALQPIVAINKRAVGPAYCKHASCLVLPELSYITPTHGTCHLQYSAAYHLPQHPPPLDLSELQVLELLADHLRQWALSIAFPELAHLPFLALRGYAKASPVERFRRHSKSLADAVARNTTWVGAARDAVAYAPHDLGAVAGFLAGQEAKVRGLHWPLAWMLVSHQSINLDWLQSHSYAKTGRSCLLSCHCLLHQIQVTLAACAEQGRPLSAAAPV
jgi:hypothetical protein